MNLLIVTQKVDENDDLLGFFHSWIEEFAKNYEKVVVICLQKGEDSLPNNIKVLSLGKEYGESRLKYVLNFYKYIWQERENYDSIFVHMNQVYIIFGWAFWKITGKKIGLWYTHKSVGWQLKIAEKLSNVIFTASKESFRLSSKKLKIVGHGIDLNRFKIRDFREDNKKFKLISIGRISPVKDYDTLVNAIDLLVHKKGIKNLEVEIIGSAGLNDQKKYYSNLITKVKNRRLNMVIKFLGAIPNKDVVNNLQDADLFVHMSNTGSLDKAILEAMACGLMVISSNDASKSLLEEYKDIALFKKGDFVDMAIKIENIIKLNFEKRIQFGKKFRKIVEDGYELKKLIKKIKNEYPSK